MGNTRSALLAATTNVEESMGVRQVELSPVLGPRATAKDIGRRPSREYGELEVGKIIVAPNQPRTKFDDDEIMELAKSIRHTGQIQPIGVRWHDDLSAWMVVFGERRLRAMQLAGISRARCFFYEDEIDESTKLEIQLVENLFRKNLSALDEANGYQSLMELNGWNGKQVAEALRVSPSRVSRALALLELPAEVQRKLATGQLGKTAAYELTKLESDATVIDLASRANRLTQKQATKAVRQRRGKAARKHAGVRLAFPTECGITVNVTSRSRCNYHEVEQALRQVLDEVRLRIDNNVHL